MERARSHLACPFSSDAAFQCVNLLEAQQQRGYCMLFGSNAGPLRLPTMLIPMSFSETAECRVS